VTAAAMSRVSILVWLRPREEDVESRARSNRHGCLYPQRPWKTLEEVEIATLRYIDCFNNTRHYEENGDIPPVELKQAFYRLHRPSA
jgi:hypothetical protein